MSRSRSSTTAASVGHVLGYPDSVVSRSPLRSGLLCSAPLHHVCCCLCTAPAPRPAQLALQPDVVVKPGHRSNPRPSEAKEQRWDEPWQARRQGGGPTGFLSRTLGKGGPRTASSLHYGLWGGGPHQIILSQDQPRLSAGLNPEALMLPPHPLQLQCPAWEGQRFSVS